MMFDDACDAVWIKSRILVRDPVAVVRAKIVDAPLAVTCHSRIAAELTMAGQHK